MFTALQFMFYLCIRYLTFPTTIEHFPYKPIISIITMTELSEANDDYDVNNDDDGGDDNEKKGYDKNYDNDNSNI